MSAILKFEEPDAQRALIQLEAVTKTYDSGENAVQALRGIDLAVTRGEFAAIIGPSGSGKSTLMHILGCLDTPTSGRYWLDGEDAAELSSRQLARIRNQKIGFVFQTFNLLPRATILKNVELRLLSPGPSDSVRRPPPSPATSGSDRRERAMEALQRVGLANRAKHRPNELSGGQRQRVAIARALVNTPSLILADEPTGNLDQKTGHEIIAIFEKLVSQDETIIIVTHDPSIASRTGRRIKIVDGEIVDG